MLYLTTAWETGDREGDPAVLYCGSDMAKATNAAVAAPARFLRVELAHVHFSIPQSRPSKPTASLPVSAPVAAPAAPSSAASAVVPETPAAEPAPSETAAASSGDEGGEEEGGPQLPSAEPVAGKSKRK